MAKLIDDHAENTSETLGSIICTNVRTDLTYGKYQIRDYQGLSSDFSKLPTYSDLGTGSSFYAIDTGDLYLYDATSKTWILQ